jgi:hypothetical protein
MRHAALWFCLLGLTPSHAHDIAKSTLGEAPITITINPEARVSVTRTGDLPKGPCGTSFDVPVNIVNRAFATSSLVVDSSPTDARLEWSPTPLLGMPEERRTLRVAIKTKADMDVTIAFRPSNDVPDLGGRDRVHFLVTCYDADQARP